MEKIKIGRYVYRVITEKYARSIGAFDQDRSPVYDRAGQKYWQIKIGRENENYLVKNKERW